MTLCANNFPENSQGSDSPQPHPATAKAWSWFEEHGSEMNYDRRERILLELAALDADLWKLDNETANSQPNEASESGYNRAAVRGGVLSGALSCPKCSGGEVLTRYHTGDTYWGNALTCAYGSNSSANANTRKGEHLHYRCKTCEYDWTGDVAPANSQPKGPNDAGD